MLKKIMVVDNSKAILRFMTDLLAGRGYEVVTAMDGLDALELLHDFVPDLMFIDLVMPKIGGDKLCRILRKRPEFNDTFLVILSAIAAERHFNSLDYCADACIAKGPAAQIEKHILAVLAQREAGQSQPPLSREVMGASETFKREVVAELLGSKDHFEITLEHMAEGFIEFTPENKIIFANPAASLLFKIPEEKLLAINFLDLFQAEERQLIAATLAGLSEEPVAVGEDLPLLVNGRQVQVNFLPVVDDEQRYVIAIIHDITDRRLAAEAGRRQQKYLEELVQARTEDLLASNRKLQREIQERIGVEERLRRTQASLEKAQQIAKMGNWEWDVGARVVSWSEQMYRIFQIEGEQFDGSYDSFLALVHADDLAYVEECRHRAVANGKGYSLDHRILLADGRELTLHEQAEFVGGGETGLRMFGTSQDVTERKRLESQLLHARKMEAIGQLAAGIAHEVNTPTQYIGDNLHFCQEVFAELLPLHDKFRQLLPFLQETAAAQGLKGELERMMVEIELEYLQKEIPIALAQATEGNKRVAEIVMAMKEFAHPGSKEKSAIDLNHAIGTTLLVARNAWKYVTGLETDFDPALPLVPCLPSEFNQVILNIVVNAAQAIGELMKPPSAFKGVIAIRTRKVDDWAEITIKDNGPGMAEAVRNRIFTPFFTTKKVGQGTGQGLAIAYAIIVDKHHGTIEVESKVGVGTTFTIRLPLWTEE